MEVSSQLHALAALPAGKEPLVLHWIGGLMGPRAGLDAVVERKNPSPYRDSNPRSSSPLPSDIPLNYFCSIMKYKIIRLKFRHYE
jgi:hypothetical protein